MFPADAYFEAARPQNDFFSEAVPSDGFTIFSVCAFSVFACEAGTPA
jgi:hypothetical protein